AGDDVRPVAQALEVEGLSDLADEVRGIVRRRTVDAEADGHARILEFDGAGDARGQAHVRRRAVGHCGTGGAEAVDLVLVEVDPVGQPGPVAQPTAGLEVVRRALSEPLPAEVVLIDGLGQAGVQADVELSGQDRALAYEYGGHRERGAGG